LKIFEISELGPFHFQLQTLIAKQTFGQWK